MSMVGTFDGFTAARLGLYAAQHGLRVTGNNVANINTIGYTRQRTDQSSFKVGANDMYRSFYDNHIGSGALVTGISQIRDPYLDIRYRNASTDTYHYDTWLSGLQGIATILDEVGKGENYGDGLLYRQLQDLAEKLRAYGNDPTSLNDRLVRNSAQSLVGLFHNAATQLEKRYNETKTQFGENITKVNEILTNIRDLNKSIREAEIHGDAALEMRDERNRQIDSLSQYLDITVQYSFEDVGAGIQVEKLTISLNDANPDPSVTTDSSVLVDGLYATQLSVPEERPALNPYANTEDPKYAYLKNYKYLKEVTPKDIEELMGYFGDGPKPGSLDDLIPARDENGNVREGVYLIGTNDPDVDGIVTEPNDNFTIQLGKLLNVKGAEWKKSTTIWTELTGDNAPSLATKTYGIAIDKNALLGSDGTFYIGDVQYNVKDIFGSLDNFDDNQFLSFVADKLSELYPNYNVSAKDGQITFKAKKAGSMKEQEPDLKQKNLNTWLTLTDNNDFKDGSLPTGVDDYPIYEYDEHGNVTKSINYVEVEGKWYAIAVNTEYTHEVTLDDNDLRGILQAQREMLTEEGEFASAKDVAIDENALTKRGIPYYMKSLDLLAQKFAKAYNQLNQGYAYNQDGYYIKNNGEQLILEDGAGNSLGPISINGLTDDQRKFLIDEGYILKNEDNYLIDENGSLITDKDGNPILYDPQNPSDKAVVDVNRLLEELGGYSMGGALFTQIDGKTTEGITAANISISHGWSNGLWNLVPTFEMLFAEDGSGGLTNSTQSSNASHMIAMIEKSLTYNPRDLDGSDAIGPELFNGSFNDMLSNMMAVQGEDASMTKVSLTTAAGILNEVDYSREGVSGVDLNDEAMNMITYQKAMSAAMRVMTTIDEMLDRLINNTGIAGR